MNTDHLPQTPGVYVLFCKQTGLSYVGASKNLRRRIRGHINRLKTGTHNCGAVQELYGRVGIDGIDVHIAGLCREDELERKEHKLWSKLRDAGMLLEGQERSFQPRKKRTRSPASAAAMRKRWADPASREKLVNAMRAVEYTKENREARAESISLGLRKRWMATTPSMASTAGTQKVKSGWAASIGKNGKSMYLGTFKTQEEAHAAYVKAWEKRRAQIE